MSSRYYPLFRRGNPQLRVFLPNFHMKLIKSKVDLPPNMVKFEVPTQMTQYDVRNYLEKIYKIPVVHVRTEVVLGAIKPQKPKRYLIKEEDYRVATVTLPEGCRMKFPKLFNENHLGTQMEKLEKEQKAAGELERKYKRADPLRSNVPDWFGI